MSLALLRLLADAGFGFAVGALPVLLVHGMVRWHKRRRARRLATASDTDLHVIKKPSKVFAGKDAFAAHSVRERPDHTLSCRLATVEQLIAELQARVALEDGDGGMVVGLVIKADFQGAPCMKTTLCRAGSRASQLRVLHAMLRAANRDWEDDLAETKA